MRKNKEVDLEFLKLQYQVLSNKQISHNTRVWNTPSLLFIAETLLWGVTFNEYVPSFLALLFSIFSICVAWAAWQQFVRERIMDIADCEQLCAVERIIKENPQSKKEPLVMTVHHTLKERTILTQYGELHLEDHLVLNSQFYENSILGKINTFYVWDRIFLFALLLSVALSSYRFYDFIFPLLI